MVAETQGKKYSLPVLASFISLGLKNEGEEYGVIPTFVSDNGLISGGNARKILERFYVGESGVQRLYRRNGDWYAILDYLGNFYANCRVGRISGEASKKDLQALAQTQIEQNFSRKKAELEQQLQNLPTSEQACMESAQSILNR